MYMQHSQSSSLHYNTCPNFKITDYKIFFLYLSHLWGVLNLRQKSYAEMFMECQCLFKQICLSKFAYNKQKNLANLLTESASKM